MKHVFLGSIAVCAALSAEQLADPDQFKPLKSGNPPRIITPNVAQGYRVENQFDRNERDYYSVTDKINSAMSPLKLTSGFYGPNFYDSLTAGFMDERFYGMVNTNFTKANDYQDGDGNHVDWGYKRLGQGAVLGWKPNAFSEYRLTYLHDEIKDDKQPEYQMDPVSTERHVFKFDARGGEEDLSNTVNFNFTYRKLDRKVNNYQIRDVQNADQMARIKLERDVYDFSLKYDRDFAKSFHNLIGVSYERDEQMGERYKHTAQKDILNAYRFPDVNINRYRIFDTLSYEINEMNKISLGFTYEYNDARMKKANELLDNPQNARMKFPSAIQLWNYYYGGNYEDNVDTEAFSAELMHEFKPNELQTYKTSIAHVERVGSNFERFNALSGGLVYNTMQRRLVAQNAAMAKQGVIGNPYLANEAHNYFKFEMDARNGSYKGYMNSLLGAGFNFGSTLMYDNVKNLIIFDRARGQSGVAVKDGAIIARNVDAKIALAKLFARYNFARNWGASAKLYAAYGRNDTDERYLYQMRPFEFDLSLDYKDYFSLGSWNAGAAMRAVSRQSKGDFSVDSGLGIDREETAKGFATFDLYAGVEFRNHLGVKFGVNNVFDKTYAEFISADHIEALAPTNVVYAPGRTFWASFNYAY